MKIFIKLLSDTNNINIEITNDVFMVNGEKKDVNIRMFVNKLLSIVGCWDAEMFNNKQTDADSFEVVINDGGKQYKYSGRGEYPINYYEFVKLINEVAND